MVRPSLKAAVLWALILSSAPVPALAQASPESPPPASPDAVLDEAMRRILGIFDLLIQAVPQYEPPEVLDNGDIIIRRKRPGENKERDGKPIEEEPTRTRI